MLPDFGAGQVITRNRRQAPRIDFVGSDSKHRDAVERIAGATKWTEDPAADSFCDPRGCRGAILVYIAGDLSDLGLEKCNADMMPIEPSPHDLVALFSLVAPATATPHGRSVIEWTVRRKDLLGTPSVDVRE
jgi:hypothetical protein